jgi:hypothetical protein
VSDPEDRLDIERVEQMAHAGRDTGQRQFCRVRPFGESVPWKIRRYKSEMACEQWRETPP